MVFQHSAVQSFLTIVCARVVPAIAFQHVFLDYPIVLS